MVIDIIPLQSTCTTTSMGVVLVGVAVTVRMRLVKGMVPWAAMS